MPDADTLHLQEGLLFGMGNPLLDIQAHVNKGFLEKWNLKENDAIICDDKLIPMFHELVEKFEVEYVPGGATQNSLRVAQWILGKPKVATFMGCIGSDEFGRKLHSKMQEAGVNAVYQIHPKEKTGTCAVGIVSPHRSLCAHLAAANCFTKDHLDANEHKTLMERAQFYYISGFFLTVCPAAIMEVARHAAACDKVFAMNLSAPFIVQAFNEPLMEAMPYVDIIFGNDTEAVEISRKLGFNTEKVDEIALKLSQLPKINTNRHRLAVITQGPDPVVVARDGEVTKFAVTAVAKEALIDTNAAGDSFVGGFLAQYIQGKPLAECIRCGNWSANVILQRSGCTFPSICDYK